MRDRGDDFFRLFRKRRKSSKSPPALPPSKREEIVHAASHGLGFLASVVGLVVLVMAARERGDAWHLVGCSIFGVTLVLLYAASTLYHSCPESSAKRVFQRMDHIAIYLLIAGTYTPFTLVKMRGPWGWTLLALVWSLAGLGIVLELVRKSRTRRTSVALYLVMGWLVVFALQPLAREVEPGGIVLLALGGLTYSVGVIFYAWSRLPYNHAVWHAFVLGGSALHFGSVLVFVIP